MNAEDALAYSCNSYFAEMATRLTVDELQAALRKAGLDAPSGLAKEESVGNIEKAETREALQLEALGDRGIEVTALELLGAYRKLALQKRSGNLTKDEAVFAGLEESVTYGMAHAANVGGTKVAGKTGTAASRASIGTHGFFVGYAPAEKPEIAIVVYLPQGRGMDAAAVAQSVLAEFAESERK
jgi:cell division protein FtsI/penicillin-binding protein 2